MKNQTKKALKVGIDAYFYGVMIGSMFTWIHVIGNAAQQNWIIILDFNMYGEGALEYAMCLIWLVVALVKGTWLFIDWLNRENEVIEL